VFAEAAQVERFVDWVVRDAFGCEIAFVESVYRDAANDRRIFFFDLGDESCEARVGGDIFERAKRSAFGVEALVGVGHFFEEVESFCVLADGRFVEG
jgi:hypothetical protein